MQLFGMEKIKELRQKYQKFTVGMFYIVNYSFVLSIGNHNVFYNYQLILIFIKVVPTQNQGMVKIKSSMGTETMAISVYKPKLTWFPHTGNFLKKKKKL